MRPKIEIIGDAQIAAPCIEWAKNIYKTQGQVLQSYYLPDCLVQIDKNKNSILFITLNKTGIVGHPRTSDEIRAVLVGDKYKLTIPGGWYNGGDELDSSAVFPLDDSDNASFLVDENGTGSFLGDTGNYGNSYWHNADFSTVISYKTPPIKHQLADKGSNSSYDFCVYEFGGYYGYYIYQKGEILAASPKTPDGDFYGIRGAAFIDNILLVATQHFLFKTTIGAKELVWEIIYALPYAAQWQFNSTGTALISSAGVSILLSPDYMSVINVTDLTNASQNTSISDYNNMSFSGGIGVFHEMLDDSPVYNVITYTSSFLSTLPTTSGITYGDIPLYMKYPPTDVRIELPANAEGCIVVSYYRADGMRIDYPTYCGAPTIKIEGPVYESPPGSGCWKLNTTCNYQAQNTVTATVTGVNGSFEITGSVEVTLPTHAGWWEEVSCDFTHLTTAPDCGVVDNSAGFCDADYASDVIEISNNSRKTFIGPFYPGTYSYIKRYVHTASPVVVKCGRCTRTYGAMGGEVWKTTPAAVIVDKIYNCVGGGIDCSNGTGCLFGAESSFESTETYVEEFITNAPYKTYKWVCA